MNDRKFCFIMCANQELLLEEAIHYIQHLEVPEGYETELLTVGDAACMTAGYQEAMECSDAKYKIYLHQDVFVLNRFLLSDLLAIFQSDERIGMIGMVGYERISADGIMWHAKRLGTLYLHHPSEPYMRLADYRYSLQKDSYQKAALVDGFFMATSRDLPWETDLLKGWDFYDAFQSLAFLKAGYQIAVPNQRHPWCMHDDGEVANMEHYDKNRQIFMREYGALLGRNLSEIEEFILRQKTGCEARKDRI